MTVQSETGSASAVDLANERVLSASDGRSEAGARFKELADLQKGHLELLQREPDGDASMSDEFRKEIGIFMDCARATGAVLDRDRDRRSAQAAIDYWITALILAGLRDTRRDPPVVLAPFDPAYLPDLQHIPSPYKGLAAFDEQDAENFFGRERAAMELVDRIAEQPLIVVSGPSGSGKSSLLQAGVMPLLRNDLAGANGTYELLAVVTPGHDPVSALLHSILPDATNAELRDEYAAVTQSPARLSSLLDRRPKPVILVIDQLEELFTLQSPSNAQPANVFGVGLGAVNSRHRLVVSLREDHLDNLRRLPVMGEKVVGHAGMFKTGALSPRALKRIIEAPAESVGLRFEDGIVNDLVGEVVGEPAALPLLQFTLSKLWERRTRNIITLEAYLAVGSPRYALAQAADAVYGQLLDEDKGPARRLLMKLVTQAAENEFVRNPQSRAALEVGEASDRVERILDRFVKAGLLRTRLGRDRSEDLFDVAHEALIRNWQKFGGWLRDASREDQTRFRLETVAKQWRQSGGDAGYLLSGRALKEAYAYRERSEDLRQLIIASDFVATRRRRFSVAFGVLILFTVITFGWYQVQLDRLEREEAFFQENKELWSRITPLRTELARTKLELDGDRRRLARIDRAIAEGNLTELRAALREIGLSDADANRVVLTGAASPATVRDRPPELDQTVDQRPSSPPLGTVGQCPGAIWIGNPTNSKVVQFPGERTGLKDRQLELAANIVLRASLPTETYVMTPVLGVVPKGTAVMVTGDAQIFERSLGPQWWVPVTAPREVCSKVLIQYSGTEEDVLNRLQRIVVLLRNLGFQVPAPQPIGKAAGLAEVRYFHEGDAQLADLVVSKIQSAGSPQAKSVSLEKWPYTKPLRGTVELWLDLK